jgi:hypothetical protein
MTLSNPVFLWSLLGLSIPIVIHLLSRKEGKVIRLGSIRHVQETSTQQFKGIKLNELLLLVLRCAMIFIFSLLLSGLQCSGISNEKWVVIENGLESDPFVKTVLDSLINDGYEKHQLSEGFPTLHNDSITNINYWNLAQELGTMNLSSAVVFASNKATQFNGKRIALASNVKWISVPQPKVDYPLQAIRLNDDSLYLRTGHSSNEETYFSSEKIKFSPQIISISPPDSIRILIVSDESYTYDRKMIVASLKAISKSFPIKMKIRESVSLEVSHANFDWCFWLTDEKVLPNGSVKIIRMLPSNSNELIVRQQSNVRDLTKRLNEEVVIDKNLTLLLAQLIIPAKELQNVANANDKRMMPDSLAWSNGSTKSAVISTSLSDRLLIICLIALLIVERIISYNRNQ